MKTITLEKFHEILEDCYAVAIDDTLYFIGHDDIGPFFADTDMQEYTSLAEVDGKIEVTEKGIFFSIASEDFLLVPLMNAMTSLFN
jgi:hypothetical protein